MAKKTAPKPADDGSTVQAPALNPLVLKVAEFLLQFILAWLTKAQAVPRSASTQGDRNFLLEHRVLKVQGGRKSGYTATAIALANKATVPVLYLVNDAVYRTSPQPAFTNDQVQVLPVLALADQDGVDDLDPCGLVVIDAAGDNINQAAVVNATSAWLSSYPKLAYIIVG